QHLDRVVIPGPGGGLKLAEPFGDGAGRVVVDGEREGRYAAVHRLEPVERARIGEPVEKALAEQALLRLDRRPADRVDVLDGGDEAGEQLMGERAGLEAAAERLQVGRAHLVRTPRLEQLRASEREPEMRPEELVRRAD